VWASQREWEFQVNVLHALGERGSYHGVAHHGDAHKTDTDK
jgi:hypothetical protein